jgi:hypothetical protein
MIGDVRNFLEARPFQPFVIVTTGGQRYRVPTPEHAGTNPNRSRVVIWFDDGSSVTIAGLHVAAIEKGAVETNGAA